MAYGNDLLAGHIPVAPVDTLAGALDNPWPETIAMRDSAPHPDRENLKILASPIKLNGERPPNRAGPFLGEDSEDILAGLGNGPDAIKGLRREDVI